MLLGSLQVTSGSSALPEPKLFPTDAATSLFQAVCSVPGSPCGCLLDLHRLCAWLPRRVLPWAEKRPTSRSHPALHLLTEALPPLLPGDSHQNWSTRPFSSPRDDSSDEALQSLEPILPRSLRYSHPLPPARKPPPSPPSGSGDPSHLRGERCAYRGIAASFSGATTLGI